MHGGAIDADEDTVRDGSPCWVLGAAIETNLRIEGKF